MCCFISAFGAAQAKAGAFAVTGSGAMLSEAVHTLADLGNQTLLKVSGHAADCSLPSCLLLFHPGAVGECGW
jgi:divalent metal cation (Fe/Co/Zn/Cd) transporter